MTGGKQPQLGFTIVETLIVLAVSGVIFLSTALLISGKINKTEFTQSIQDIQSQMQQDINNIADGFYPTLSNFTCKDNGRATVDITNASNGQGTNVGCIFLGKVVEFGIHGTDPQEFITYTVAGRQIDNGQDVRFYATPGKPSAQPLVIANGQGSPGSSVPNYLTGTPGTLQNGLTVSDPNMWYCTATFDASTRCIPPPAPPARKIGAVGFLSSLAGLDPSTGNLVSGSQHVNLIPIVGSQLDDQEPSAVKDINRYLEGSSPGPDDFVTAPASAVQICFLSGTTTNQSALMTISTNAEQPTVNLYIKSSTDCT